MKSFIFCILFFVISAVSAEFPIGVYMLAPEEDASHEITLKFGIGYVQNYLNPYKGAEAVDKQMANAAKHGQKVLFNMCRGGVLDEPDFLEKNREMVRKYKDHPALGMWYLYDEPTGEVMRDKLQQVYRMLKEETPDIPVALCLAWTKDYSIFKDCADFMMPDIYPVKNQPFPEAPLRIFPEFVWNVTRMKKPVIPIAQIKSFKTYPEMMKKANIDPASCRYPTYDEIRYYNFSTMVMDIKGMFYYSFYDIWRDKQMSYFEETAGPAIKELREFATLIDGAKFTALTTPIGQGKLPDYLAASWIGNGGGWIVLVNNTATELAGDFALQQPAGKGKLIPWGKTRDAGASVSGKTLKLDKLAPWEVMVWSLK